MMRGLRSHLPFLRRLTTLPQRPLSQPTSFTHSHLLSPTEITPGITRSDYYTRRTNLANRLPPNSLTVFPSNPQVFMSEDVPFLYHHNTDLLYIAGITEPGAVLVAEKGVSDVIYTLFVGPRDEAKELWEGPLCGTGNEVRDYFGVDNVLDTGRFGSYITSAMGEVSSFHFDGRINPEITQLLRGMDKGVLESLIRKWQNTTPKQFVQEERLVKSEAEVRLLKRSAQIMSEALNETIAKCGVDVEERVIEAGLEYGCKIRGARRMAFPCVVASGNNGTVLHYMANDTVAQNGDMVMVDAGCQYHGYCSDVSRSFPIGGTFTAAQREIYALCLEVQKDVLGKIAPGISLDELHIHAVKEISRGLFDMGFWQGVSLDNVLERGLYMDYFPHAIGHYLGLDVHDTHLISKSKKLESGMVVTVEPGIYCRGTVPNGFEGIGIRIEDDVLVTENGAQVLSSAVKEIDDVEALIKS